MTPYDQKKSEVEPIKCVLERSSGANLELQLQFKLRLKFGCRPEWPTASGAARGSSRREEKDGSRRCSTRVPPGGTPCGTAGCRTPLHRAPEGRSPIHTLFPGVRLAHAGHLAAGPNPIRPCTGGSGWVNAPPGSPGLLGQTGGSGLAPPMEPPGLHRRLPSGPPSGRPWQASGPPFAGAALIRDGRKARSAPRWTHQTQR